MTVKTAPAATPVRQHRLPFWHQLRWQLIVYFIALAIGAVTIVTTFTLVQVRNQSTQQGFRQLESVAELKENQIEQWLLNADIAMNLMSANLVGHDDVVEFNSDANLSAEDQTRLNAALRERIDHQVDQPTEQHILEDIFIYSLDGRVLGASNEALVNRIVTLQPYFEPSLAGHYVQSPYYDVASGELTMIITHPLHDEAGEVVGIVAGKLNIDVLRQIAAERAGLGDTGETYLVSLENNYLLTPSRFENYDMNRAYRSDGIQNALTGENGSGIYQNYESPSVTVLGVYRWIPELNAALMSEISETEAQTLFTQTSSVIGALSLVIAAIAGGIGLFLASTIARPIRELTGIARQVASGDFSQRSTVRTSNEIGTLSETFNQMTGQLAQTIAELDDKIGELNDRNDELRVQTAKAREAARVKGEFLANVSHELRTPLNAIIGFSDMLLMGMSGELNAKQRHKMERLRENGTRLLNLINDILDITRIEARRIEIIAKPFAPRAMIERISAQTAVLAEQNKLDLYVEIDSDLPDTLIGDEKRIEQVMVNMLSNAFKFTEKGSVTLAVRANPQDARWNIVVSDTGIGIPPHALTIIFEEFRQVDGGGTRAYKGSGLGLAITRNLVRMMDGQIGVQSEIGKGSIFTVTLPLETPESAKQALLESVEA